MIRWDEVDRLLEQASESIDNAGGYLVDLEDEAAETLRGIHELLQPVRALIAERLAEPDLPDEDDDAPTLVGDDADEGDCATCGEPIARDEDGAWIHADVDDPDGWDHVAEPAEVEA